MTANPLAVHHRTFSIDRSYPHPPERVFRAFADPRIKQRWFAEGEGWEIEEFSVDFRVGGIELSRFRFKGGPPMRNETIYLDLVPEKRMVFSYTMTLGEDKLSVSLATVEIAPTKGGSKLTYTEQGAFFGDANQALHRETGCRELFEKLAQELESLPDDLM